MVREVRHRRYCWVAVGLPGLLGLDQAADLDQVVGEHPVAAPDPGAVDAVHQGAVPAVAVLEVADAPLGAGAPLDQPPERSGVLLGSAGSAWVAPSGGRHTPPP